MVLYKVKKGRKFYVADPAKGLVKYNIEEFKNHCISTRSNGEEKGIAMFLEPTPVFYSHKEDGESEKNKNPRSFCFLFGYVKKYKRYFGQIVLGLIMGSLPSALLASARSPDWMSLPASLSAIKPYGSRCSGRPSLTAIGAIPLAASLTSSSRCG